MRNQTERHVQANIGWTSLMRSGMNGAVVSEDLDYQVGGLHYCVNVDLDILYYIGGKEVHNSLDFNNVCLRYPQCIQNTHSNSLTLKEMSGLHSQIQESLIFRELCGKIEEAEDKILANTKMFLLVNGDSEAP